MLKIDEEKGEIERQVAIWCKVRHYPYESYVKLNISNKSILHNIICVPAKQVSELQRKTLLRNMFATGNLAEGRDSVDPADLMPVETQGILLSPLTPEEITQYFSRY